MIHALKTAFSPALYSFPGGALKSYKWRQTELLNKTFSLLHEGTQGRKIVNKLCTYLNYASKTLNVMDASYTNWRHLGACELFSSPEPRLVTIRFFRSHGPTFPLWPRISNWRFIRNSLFQVYSQLGRLDFPPLSRFCGLISRTATEGRSAENSTFLICRAGVVKRAGPSKKSVTHLHSNLDF